MKLKKIASLMLAGVMAVSMLTACGGNTINNGGEDEGEGQISTSNSATILHDAMNGDARKMTTPAANTALDAALKNAVDTYFQNDGFSGVTTNVVAKEKETSKIADALISAMSAKTNISQDLADTKDNDKVTTVVKLYAVNASVSDTYALEKVATVIENSVAGLKDKSSNGEWNYTYTVSASIVTKPITSSMVEGITGGVKYIAVAVTQTPAKVV